MSLQTTIKYLESKLSPHKSDKQLAYELHDLLTDDADWSDEYWDFDRDALITFSLKIKKLYDDSPHGLSFQAIWSPDRVNSVMEVSIEQLEQIFIANKVATKTRYVARKPK